ncbi:MAG TPA: glycosyltransferase family 4 protein [Bacilli bacterium]
MSENRLKIMLFSHICSPSHITGAEKMLIFFIQELREHHECLLIVPNEGLLSEEARARGIQTIAEPYSIVWKTYSPDLLLQEILDGLTRTENTSLGLLLRLLHSHRPDLVIANTCVNALPPIAAKALGIPVAWMITERILQNEFTPVAAELIDRYADWIVGISSTALAPFQGEVIEPKKSILYPSWSIDQLNQPSWPSYREVKRSELRLLEGDRLLGYISSDIYPSKGADHFIQMALSLCTEFDHVFFAIVGKPTDPFYYGQCVEMIQGSGYASRFHLLPFQKQTEELYPAMDIVVVPSLVEEGFGMTALEGMIFGKPVAAYASGGLAEIMTRTGNTNFLAAKGQIDQLIQVVRPLLLDDKLRQQIGGQNLLAVDNSFGPQSYRIQLGRLMDGIGQSLPFLVRHDAVTPHAAMHSLLTILIRGSGPTIFLLNNGVRYPFPTERVFRGWLYGFDRVIELPDTVVEVLPKGPLIRRAPWDLMPRKQKKAGLKIKRKRRRKKRRLLPKLVRRMLRKNPAAKRKGSARKVRRKSTVKRFWLKTRAPRHTVVERKRRWAA